MSIWAIIPVKALHEGKSRLSGILSVEERVRLTSDMVRHMLCVLAETPQIARTLVVSRDPAALKLARRQGARTFAESANSNLNDALARAAQIAAAQQARGILILPADLPFLRRQDVEALLEPALAMVGARSDMITRRMIALCPDQVEDGTNALFVAPPVGFNFHYGPGSFRRHQDEAARLGMSVHVVSTRGARFDLDTEEDWRRYVAARPHPYKNPSTTPEPS